MPRERKSPWPMTPMDDALSAILYEAQPLAPVKVPIEQAYDGILAESVQATEPQPPFPASIMDGYAVVSSDGPGVYPVVGRITAGVDPEAAGIKVTPGTVAYITTGAKMPPGADAVVKVEDTEDVEGAEEGEETSVKILASGTEAGKWIRAVGSDMAVGEVVLTGGTELAAAKIGLQASLGAAEIGLLASVGISRVEINRRPVIGVLSTGDELVDASSTGATETGKIRDSNRPSLIALYGSVVGPGNVLDFGIIADAEGEDALAEKVSRALERCDVLVTSGGVSMGEADLLKPVLSSLGTLHFGRLNMKPGKPTTFATIEVKGSKTPKLVFALPGNPVSCMVCSHLLVHPALRRLQGLPIASCMAPQFIPPYDGCKAYPWPPAWPLNYVPVVLQGPVNLDPERPEYQRVCLQWDYKLKAFVAQTTGGQRSSRLLSMRSANGLICLPSGNGTLPKGSEVTALVIGPLPPPPPSKCYHRKAAGGQEVEVEANTSMVGKASSWLGGLVSNVTSSLSPTRAKAGEASALEGCPCCQTNIQLPPGGIKVGLLTISDRASDGTYEDKSGPAMAAMLESPAFASAGIQAVVVAHTIIPDEVSEIQKIIKHWSDEVKVDMIFTSGGTGFAPRDLTPEAIRPLLHKEAPGIIFRIMQVGTQHTPFAALSRPIAGVRNQTFIVTLPGSPKAVKENLETLVPLLPKIYQLITTSTCDHKT